MIRIRKRVQNVEGSLVKAVILVLSGLFLLDIMGVIIKSMGDKYSVLQYTVARNSFGLLPILIFLFYSFGSKWNTGRFNLRDKIISVCRGLSIVFAQICFYLAVIKLEYATAATLAFASPIFLTALSVPILRNQVGPWRWFAVALGFIGIVIIIKPNSDIFSNESLLPLGAAFGYALAAVLVKLFPKEVHTARIQLYTQMTTLIATLIIAISTFSLTFILSLTDLFFLGLMGISGGIGVILLISGYRLTEPSLIAPFEYFALPISFILGWIFFLEWPFEKLFPGLLGIIFGGVIIAWRESRKK